MVLRDRALQRAAVTEQRRWKLFVPRSDARLGSGMLSRRKITGRFDTNATLRASGALALISLSLSIQDSAREGMDEMGDDLVVMQKGASDVFGGLHS
jgi:hypothetical protein